tara:strand:+ start:3678 stop:4862 length:1185 start_codon:yes stop_codon:yes gene_type:complete
MPRPKTLIVKKLFTDEEIAKREGTWFEESDIHYPIVNTNTDIYRFDDDGNKHLLLKFRKNCVPQELIQLGWDSYKDLAKASRGRGASAGPIDTTSQYWGKRKLVDTKKWSTGYLNPKGLELHELYSHFELSALKMKCDELEIKYSEDISTEDCIKLLIKKQGGISKMKVNNQVASNPIGFYEAGKNFADLPCRLTHFTRTNFEKYNNGLPFIQKIDQLFKRLIPDAHERQLERANLKSHLKIPKTCFSTVTINRNFRTAMHRDAGDFKGGFGNLTVIERGKYHGGYTIFPQYGVAIDLRNNDFVAMDVHQWHCNTPLYETEEDKKFNETMEPVFKDNPEVGTAGIYENYTRISFVCYLREKIAKCPDKIDPRFLTKSGHSKIPKEEIPKEEIKS